MSDDIDKKDQKKVLDFLNDRSVKEHPSMSFTAEEIAKGTGLEVNKVKEIGNDAIGREWVDIDGYGEADWIIRINSKGKTARDELQSGKNIQNIPDQKIFAGRDVNIINAGNDNKIETKEIISKNKTPSKTKLVLLIVGTIATLILVGYAVYDHPYPKESNTYQPPDIIKNQNDFSVNNRAYLAVVKIEEYEKNKVWFIYQNFGKIPNTNGIMRIAAGDNITRNDLYDSSKPTLPSGVLLPTQEMSQKLLNLPESYMINAKSGKPLEIGILMQYNYAENEKGEYGVIVMYDNASATFDNEDTWWK